MSGKTCESVGDKQPRFDFDLYATAETASGGFSEVKTPLTFEAPSQVQIALNPKLREPYEWDSCYLGKSLTSPEV